MGQYHVMVEVASRLKFSAAANNTADVQELAELNAKFRTALDIYVEHFCRPLTLQGSFIEGIGMSPKEMVHEVQNMSVSIDVLVRAWCEHEATALLDFGFRVREVASSNNHAERSRIAQ